MDSYETIVIGGGQAGLSVGHYLAKRSRNFVILDENEQLGDAWRKRWDSLRLFTPARFNGLPGMPLEARAGRSRPRTRWRTTSRRTPSGSTSRSG